MTVIPNPTGRESIACVGNDWRQERRRSQRPDLHVSATDADNDTMTYSATSLPTGATFNTTTRPSPGRRDRNGRIVHCDLPRSGCPRSQRQRSSCDYRNRQPAPVLATIGAKSVEEASALIFTVSATDADNDTMTYSATACPPAQPSTQRREPLPGRPRSERPDRTL